MEADEADGACIETQRLLATRLAVPAVFADMWLWSCAEPMAAAEDSSAGGHEVGGGVCKLVIPPADSGP